MKNILFSLPCKILSYLFIISLLLSNTFLLCNINDNEYTKEEGFMLRRITEFWKDQDYDTVKKEIQAFLSTHSNSKFCDKLHGNYGDLLIQEGKYSQALASYEKISNQAIMETFAINKMQCYYELDQFNDIIFAGLPFLSKMSKELLDRKDEFYFLMAEGYFRSALKMSTKDKKNSYLNKSIPLYEKILNSSFNDPSMFALAEIYRLQSTNDKAQSFFLELSKRHPKRKEELLFHAALAQAEFDKAQAIETFSQIIQLSGEKKKDAVLNRLILYFQEERYDDVIDNYQTTLDLIDKDKQATLNYIIARSYFAKKFYDKATFHLSSFISNNNGTNDERRNALLMQLSTAQFLKNETLYSQTLSKLEKFFPEDRELAQAVFIHAMMLKEKGDCILAESKLASLIKNKSNFKNSEVLYLEYGLVAYNNDNWELCKNTLHSFLEKYKDTKHAPIAWKYFLSSCLNFLKINQDLKKPKYNKNEFLTDLESVMQHSQYLEEAEKIECLFLQGKIYYSLKNYIKAKACLSKFIYDHFKHSHIAEAHLLLALCHHKGENENDLFCSHAEKALKLDPSLGKKGSLHLELFNVYLTIAEDSNLSETLLDKASQHLYTALSLGETNIKLENKLWLSNWLLQKFSSDQKIFLQNIKVPVDTKLFNKCFSLFEDILLDPESNALKPIYKNETFLEWEILKLANLFEKKQNIKKKISLLQSLIEKQSLNNDWPWQAKQEILFELAKTYETNNQNNKALETYLFITTMVSKEKTFIKEYANLSSLRLTFSKLPKKIQTEKNRQITNILSKLKNLQIQKNATSEPLHLESALMYAKIRALITDDKNPSIKYLFYLGRITESFTSKLDPTVEKYQTTLKENTEALKLYTQYMKFTNAESLRMEAIIQANDNHRALSLEFNEKAKQLYKNLLKENTTLYLSSRIKESLALIKQGKLF